MSLGLNSGEVVGGARRFAQDLAFSAGIILLAGMLCALGVSGMSVFQLLRGWIPEPFHMRWTWFLPYGVIAVLALSCIVPLLWRKSHNSVYLLLSITILATLVADRYWTPMHLGAQTDAILFVAIVMRVAELRGKRSESSSLALRGLLATLVLMHMYWAQLHLPYLYAGGNESHMEMLRIAWVKSVVAVGMIMGIVVFLFSWNSPKKEPEVTGTVSR